MKPELIRPLTTEENRYARQLRAFLKEHFPFRIVMEGSDPALLPFEVEQALAREAAHQMATRMITGVAAQNAKTWRAAARESLKGKQIHQALKSEMQGSVGLRVRELIEANTKLIESIPDRLWLRSQAFITKEQQKGRRASEIIEDLQAKLPKLTQSQLQLVARTEVARADTALMQARSESLHLDWYEWNTSRDQRVRPSHEKMSGVLVAWGEPPAPEQLIGQSHSTLGHYHAGQTYNCRCVALPLVDLNEVKWPHKVYAQGHIHLVSRAQFVRLTRFSQAA